ncbi:MAG: hypothetical protein H0T42_33240 [Deltaproteobacteria bacterium]|nr:hypothetical protein [Deltaproteobacteria bacterium]
MRPHHTKNKGDLGILYAQLDLAKKGYGVLAPLTEHEAFDLVAYKDHTFYRVQVKYRKAVRGSVYVRFSTVWADRHGIHSVPIDKASIDLICVYCPDTDRCYYIDPFAYRAGVMLRVAAPRNSQTKRIVWAKDLTELPITVRGVPAGSPTPLEQSPALGQSPRSDDAVVTRP